MIVRICCAAAILPLLSLLGAEGRASNTSIPVLTISLNNPVKKFSPVFTGLMTEEINHSYDGGLYAELIRNRSFQDNPTNAEAWSLTVPQGAEATMHVTDQFPLTDKLPESLEVVISKVETNKPVSVANEGFWGIPIKPDTAYKLSFYAKGNNTWSSNWNGKYEGTNSALPLFRSALTVSLQNTNGSCATASTPMLSGEWQKIALTLKTGKDVPPSKENKFVISASTPGTFRLSLVSLFPPTYKNRANGSRVDLMDKLAGLQPKFLRLPGGNYVEGDNLWDRFDWKQMRGPLEFRAGHPGCWHYRSSDGFGLLEFMGWCEDLGMEPVLAVFAGYSMKQQALPPGPLLEPYVQEALDEIEYLTGDAKSSYWGALRAKDGHPEPFKLKYIEIGNEDFFDKSKGYDGRFAQFHDAIKAKYPDIQLIATMPVTSRKPDVVDDHYYKSTDWFVKEFHHYDNTDRKGPKIFVGEWATRSKSSGVTPSLTEALGDAAWMCAMERNADLMVKVNPGACQWKPDLIGYDALNSFVSPSWHAQELFNSHRGDEVLTASVSNEDPSNIIPYSVTRDQGKGLIHIKLVNPSLDPREIRINLGDKTKVDSKAEVVTLCAKDPAISNSLEMPVKSQINNATSDFKITIPSNALEIITLNFK